jgi:hypothetical protein
MRCFSITDKDDCIAQIEQAIRQRGMSLQSRVMNSELSQSHGRAGDRTARRLQAGKAQPSALAQLWDAMANDPTTPLELEQEALEPQSPALGWSME